MTRRRCSLALALLALGVLLAAPAPALAAPPIPEGAALWFACTQPVFRGPLSLRCPEPYDPRYLQTFLHGFQRLTPENEFKMEYLEPEQGRFTFSVADQIAAFARANGKTIRGHTLLWDDENPFWLVGPLLPWSRYALSTVMDRYITTVVSHFATQYPHVVTEWDVVNEPLNASGQLKWNPWEAVLGAGYIRTALEEAHAADPSARLVINEGGADQVGPKENAMLVLAESLKASGAPLGAVGFEAHITPDTAPSEADLVALWRRYAEAGIDVEVTELDVGDDGGVDDPAAKAEVFERYAQACRAAGNCVGFTVWGVADQYSWLGPNTDALLYTNVFRPIPAVAAIDRFLAGAQTTSVRRRTHTHRAHRRRHRHRAPRHRRPHRRG